MARPTALQPYSRGWRAPWRGQWGTFADGHCRVSKLARRIEEQLIRRFKVGEDPMVRLLVRQAARQAALGEALSGEILSGDQKARRAIRKQWTASVEGFRRALTLLGELAGPNGHGPTSPSPHELLTEVRDG